MKDNIAMAALIVALFLNAIFLAIDDFKADTFVCNDKVLAEELTPLNINALFEECTNECNKGDMNCIKTCADMIGDIVNPSNVELKEVNERLDYLDGMLKVMFDRELERMSQDVREEVG